jgi:hypothetical protein
MLLCGKRMALLHKKFMINSRFADFLSVWSTQPCPLPQSGTGCRKVKQRKNKWQTCAMT